jgi:hypothetical protein
MGGASVRVSTRQARRFSAVSVSIALKHVELYVSLINTIILVSFPFIQ